MDVFNLEFGAAKDPEEVELYLATLYPMLKQLHATVADQLGEVPADHAGAGRTGRADRRLRPAPLGAGRPQRAAAAGPGGQRALNDDSPSVAAQGGRRGPLTIDSGRLPVAGPGVMVARPFRRFPGGDGPRSGGTAPNRRRPGRRTSAMIYFGTDSGLYRWFEAAPWPVFHGLQHHAVTALAARSGGVLAALDGAGRIFETRDHGLNWRALDPPEGAGRPSAIALDGEGQGLRLACRPLSLYRRATGRSGWVPLGTPGGADEADRPASGAIGLIEHAGGSWFAAVEGAGDRDGLWQSADDGASWTRSVGIAGRIFAVRGAGDRLYAATGDGVAVSEDDGASWSPAGDLPAGLRQARALAVRPDEPSTLLVGAAPSGGAAAPLANPNRPAGLGFRLLESKDGGKTWAHVTRGFPESFEFDQIVDLRHDPAAPDYAVAALASGECWRTRNGGEWWEPLARRLGAVRALAVASP